MTKTELLRDFAKPGETINQVTERLAATLRISRSAVYLWPERLAGPRMFGYQCTLEKLTDGKIRADLADNIKIRDAKDLRDKENEACAT